MPYSAPTRSALRTSISRDLHDTGNKVFSASEVNDLINMGIAELNRLVPKEYRTEVVAVTDDYDYALNASVQELFRVEIWRDSKFYRELQERIDLSSTGWEFFSGSLYMPTQMTWDEDAGDTFVVSGYQYREPLNDDADTLDTDLEGEMIIRAYCQFTCFQRLIASRSLFQQWQVQGNNSDVSATQLLGMASVYAREWRDLRNRVRRLRRVI